MENNTETADETTETSKRLTWADVYTYDVKSLSHRDDLAAMSAWARNAGYDYIAWRGNVYRVALEGVAGAIDPPELLGTVGEILGDGILGGEK